MLNIFQLFSTKNKISFFSISFFSMLAIIFNLISSMLIIPIFFSIIDSSYIANTTFNKIFDIAGINLIKNFDHAIIFALFIIILSNLIILVSNVLKNYYQWHLITSFKKRYFDLVANLNYEKFVNLSRPEFVKDMTAEIDRLVTGYFIPIQTLITKIMFLFLCFIFLFLKNPTIASITVICITLVYFFIFLLVKKKINEKGLFYKNLVNDIGYYSHVVIEHFKLMKIYNLSNAYNKLFDKNLRNVNKIQNYFGIIKLFPRFILEIIIFSSVLLVMYLFFINENDKNDVVFFFAVLGVCSYKLLPVVQDVFFNLTLSSQNKAVLNYIKNRFDFLENNQLIKKNDYNPKLNFDTLEVKNLSFSYDKKEIIRKANIKFKIGKIYGFVGPSGSGKTTLMDILLGLFQANLGEIIVGGKKIESEMLSAYQSKIGYCSHNPLLLNDTIRNNVIFFTENDNAKLKKSLEIANLNKFIEKLEYGLETYIDDNLSSISAGEAQRISLARTFYLDKKILILDEFTSNLDSQNEKELLDNIAKMRENKIIIIVSHKTKPLEICDEVYQINDKKVDLKKK